MHTYQGVRTDYWNQITGEVKAPHRSIRGKRIWQKKSGAQVEALDGEVYALHAARAAKVHLMREHGRNRLL
jgi:phage terminase large subunit GpA-like protein